MNRTEYLARLASLQRSTVAMSAPGMSKKDFLAWLDAQIDPVSGMEVTLRKLEYRHDGWPFGDAALSERVFRDMGYWTAQ